MAIANNYDLYAFVRELADELDPEDASLAGDLRDAVLVGSLPGEVLEAIHFALERVKKTALYTSRIDRRRKVDDALSYITELLGPARR
jgi:hypothetical protein